MAMRPASIRILLALILTFAATIASARRIDSSIKVDAPSADCPGVTATATNDGPVCAATPVQLHGSSNTGGVTYSWTGPHTWMSTEQNPIAPGPGLYTLDVRTAEGCHVYSQTTVEQLTPPDMTISGEKFACGGDVVMLTLNDSSSFTDLYWVPNNESTILSGQGTPSLKLIVGNSNGGADVIVHGRHLATGCNSRSSSYGITTLERYSAEITAPSSVCPNSTITATVPNSSASYAWSVVHGTITEQPMINIVKIAPDGTGDVSVTARVTNPASDQCFSEDTATIAIGGPTANIDADLAVCGGESAVIPVTLSGTAPFFIVWSDGEVQRNLTDTHVFRTVAPSETTFYSIATFSDSTSCAGVATGVAKVAVENSFDILVPLHNVVVPRGGKATLTVQTAGDGLSYHWYQGEIGDRSHTVASGPSPAFQTPALLQNTKYWVEVIGQCGVARTSGATVAVLGRQRAARH
jgi:hypothetical protein